MEHQVFNQLFSEAESLGIRVYAVTELEKELDLLKTKYAQMKLSFDQFNEKQRQLMQRLVPNASPVLYLCIDYGNRREFGRMAFKNQLNEERNTLHDQIGILLKAAIDREHQKQSA
jgi:hypothetical protein